MYFQKCLLLLKLNNVEKYENNYRGTVPGHPGGDNGGTCQIMNRKSFGLHFVEFLLTIFF